MGKNLVSGVCWYAQLEGQVRYLQDEIDKIENAILELRLKQIGLQKVLKRYQELLERAESAEERGMRVIYIVEDDSLSFEAEEKAPMGFKVKGGEPCPQKDGLTEPQEKPKRRRSKKPAEKSSGLKDADASVA